MQVAWRTQNLIWCYFLGQDGFTCGQKKWSCRPLSKPMRGCCWRISGKQPLVLRGNAINHTAPLAMLHAGILFPNLADAAVLRDKALEILQHHLEVAFFADGNSIRIVARATIPFITANFRDAYLL